MCDASVFAFSGQKYAIISYRANFLSEFYLFFSFICAKPKKSVSLRTGNGPSQYFRICFAFIIRYQMCLYSLIGSWPLWLQISCLAFVVVWLVQMILLVAVRGKVQRRARAERRNELPIMCDQPGVSVVIYAHNQGDALERNLPAVLDNEYLDYEVIVVDDGSSDNTESVLTLLGHRYANLHHTSMSKRVNTVSHRKMAMLLGVKAAKHGIILMTQAQCIPTSRHWISSMAAHFSSHIDAVIGPVVYEDRVGIRNRFYQWDLFDRMLDAFGLTMAVKTWSGWSANMAFRKQVFYDCHDEAFQKHLGLNPGEDDLFLMGITRGNNITVACSADAVMVDSEPHLQYSWSKERMKRAFLSRYYFVLPMLVKGLERFSRLLLLAGGLTLFVVSLILQQWILTGALVALTLVHLLTFALIPYLTSRDLGVHRYFFSPLIYAFYTPLVDVSFKLRSLFKSRQYYVGRI